MSSQDKYIFPKKSDLVQIDINMVDCELPDLKNTDEAKSIVIGKWLSDWIEQALSEGKIKVNNERGKIITLTKGITIKFNGIDIILT